MQISFIFYTYKYICICVYGLHTILHISIILIESDLMGKKIILMSMDSRPTYKICFRLKGMSAVGKTTKYRSDLNYIIVTKVIFNVVYS